MFSMDYSNYANFGIIQCFSVYQQYVASFARVREDIFELFMPKVNKSLKKLENFNC